MDKRQFRSAWLIAALVFPLFSTSANADSRFAIMNTSPLVSWSHVDFTIVIPEFVRLSSAFRAAVRGGNSGQLTEPKSATTKSVFALGNGGTIVVGGMACIGMGRHLHCESDGSGQGELATSSVVAMP